MHRLMGPDRRSVLPLVAVSVFLLAACGSDSVVAQPGDGKPDFSGVWFPSGRVVRTPAELPFTAGATALVEQFQADFEIDDDPGRYCIWPGMPRAPWGAPFAVEVIHRAQDVTIIWEGYGMYRKIYMADHNPPEALLPTAMGHSIGHWEGDTLVIETTDLRPYPYMNRFPTSSDAHVVERMSLETRETDAGEQTFLVDEITVTDPKLYGEPIQLRAEAVLRPDLNILEYTCSVTLWEEYLDSRGLQLPDVDALEAP